MRHTETQLFRHKQPSSIVDMFKKVPVPSEGLQPLYLVKYNMNNLNYVCVFILHKYGQFIIAHNLSGFIFRENYATFTKIQERFPTKIINISLCTYDLNYLRFKSASIEILNSVLFA